nr:MAG TPA: hypothetical protein [Caudoviricetes sp.]
MLCDVLLLLFFRLPARLKDKKFRSDRSITSGLLFLGAMA